MSMRKMTEFIIEKFSKDGARLAHLSLPTNCTGEGSCTTYATPAFFLHTLGGSVPHVTAEVLEYIFPTCPSGDEQPRPPLQVSIDSTLTVSESVGNYGQGIAKFVGLPDSPVLLTLNNPLNPLRTGYNEKSGVAVWSRHGKKHINASHFNKLVTDYKPAIFQCLSDYDVSSESSMKRVNKSTGRAIEYVEEVTKDSKHQGIFVTIESAWFLVDEPQASKTLATLLEKLDRIEGFVISGVSMAPKKFKNDSKPDEVYVKDVNYQLLETVLSKLPQDKPRFVPGPFSLEQIVELVARGVDLFDSSFVTKMADKGEVFLLDRLEGLLPKNKHGNGNGNVVEELSIRNTGDPNEAPEETQRSLISLKDKRFFDDFSPISSVCDCYTCRKHTRSYLNHLYATDELLGPVLLMIHNLTAFSRFFEVIRYQFKSEENIGISVDEIILSKIKNCL